MISGFAIAPTLVHGTIAPKESPFAIAPTLNAERTKVSECPAFGMDFSVISYVHRFGAVRPETHFPIFEFHPFQDLIQFALVLVHNFFPFSLLLFTFPG